MLRPRSRYTAEYKLSAVKMITEQKPSVAEAAHRLDVGESGARRSSPTATKPSPITATRHRPTNCIGSAPRTRACGSSGIR